MKTITVNSVVKDAADHMISIYTGVLSNSIKVPFYIVIVTRDRFGGGTIDCLTQMCEKQLFTDVLYTPKGSLIKAIHVVDATECMDILEKLHLILYI